MLRRALRYADKRFCLGQRLDATSDPRQRRRIPWSVMLRSMMVVVMARLGSLNASKLAHDTKVRRFWVNGVFPSADRLGDIADLVAAEELRGIMRAVYTGLKRGKMIEPVHGFLPLVLDGHEVCASYQRCCPACLERSVNGHTQYYHRVVVAQLVTKRFCLLLDVELQRRGEDEVAAALRLLRRLYQHYPRAWNIVLADSLYARANFFRFVHARRDDVLTVVKDERRDLLKELECRCRRTPPTVLQHNGRCCQVWDVADCQGWPDATMPIRVIKSVEVRTVKRQRTGQQEHIHSAWAWATTCAATGAPLAELFATAHDRWCIENQGFNDVVNQWHFDHIFKHTPNAIMTFLLLIMLGHAVFNAFYHCGLHVALRVRLSRHAVARLLLAEFYHPLAAPFARSP